MPRPKIILPSDFFKTDIVALYSSGLSVGDIAEKEQKPRGQIRYRLQKCGVVFRSKDEAWRLRMERTPIKKPAECLTCKGIFESGSTSVKRTKHCSVECRRNSPLALRFWRQVTIRGPDECWEWTESNRNSQGYGQITVGNRSRQAHRVAFELAIRKLQPGENVLHSCDNPPCCNPQHLWPGTQLDNARDRDAKGRFCPLNGELNGNAVLTVSGVLAIRAEYTPGYGHAAELARKYGTTGDNIGHIVRRESWRHV
jgi:hypothetical protein